jgi:hypothetical protein
MTGTQNGRTDGRTALCIIDHVIPFATHNEVAEITNQQESVHAQCTCFQNSKNSYNCSSNTCHLGLHAINMETCFHARNL